MPSRRTLAIMLIGIMATLTAPAFGQDRGAPPPTTQPQASDPWPGMKKLLVIADVQTGWQHDSISHAMATIERMGRESGEWATIIKTDSQLITKEKLVGQGERYGGKFINARNLDFFDAIFFLGSGSGTLTDAQKADLLSFVRDDGKGFVAGHASTVAFFDWPEFIDMVGAFMDSEYPTGVMPLRRVTSDFPGADAFPSTFNYEDQFPVMRSPFSSKDAHVILALDASKMTAEQLARRPDGDFPLVWYKPYGKGRVFNSGIGHLEQVWDDPKYRELMRGAIEWALGLVDEHGNPVKAQD